jgi:hypothetical protein
LAKLLLRTAFFRLSAAKEEAGGVLSLEEGREWEEQARSSAFFAFFPLLTFSSLADALVDDVLLLPRCGQPLLALTTYLHALVIVSLRLRSASLISFLFLSDRSSPSASSTPSAFLLSQIHRLVSSLKQAAWPLHLHRTLKRGNLVLEHLLPSPPAGGR